MAKKRSSAGKPEAVIKGRANWNAGGAGGGQATSKNTAGMNLEVLFHDLSWVLS